jgi:cobalamin biosynthetic protein CobC
LPGLIVLRSLGKFFGLAGARVGFVLGETTLRERLQEQLGPWAVSGPGRWIATRALADLAWQRQARLDLLGSGARLAELLRQCGLTVAGGTALFQWVTGVDAERVQNALARRGIWVRRFADPPSLRLGLPGGEADWQRLERALAEAGAGRPA